MKKNKMIISALAIITLLAALFNFTSCSSGAGAVAGKARSYDLLEGLTAGKTEKFDPEKFENKYLFATELFKKAYTGGNTMISPFSVMCALAMTANGAVGETKAEIESALGMSISDMNAFLKTFTDGLGSSDSLKIANSIWLKDTEDLVVEQSFLQTVKDYYSAGIFKREFNEETRAAINDWVDKNTSGMIKDILDKIYDNVVMYLINAIAFESEWENKYLDSQVRKGKFYGYSGKTYDANYLISTEDRFLSGDGFTGVEKYYKGGKYAFVALLPDENKTVGDIISSLDSKKYEEMFKSRTEAEVYTEIPKFKSEYSAEMSGILAKMGIEKAFLPDEADFGALGHTTDGNICMKRVLHKTFIELDEEGTRAAAATVIEMTNETAFFVRDRKEVILDRPFVYMIVDTDTNMPIFMGTMETPG